MRFRLPLLAIVLVWLALRIIFWNGYYTEDSPGYVTDATWMAVGNYHARDNVNGLNVGTYLPVALPLRVFGKSEAALGIWPLACSLLGLLSVAGAARIFFGRSSGLLAAFLYATYPGDVFFSTVVMPDALQAGWLSFSVFLVAAAYAGRESRRPLFLAAGGLAMGVCHLMRANDVLLLPIGIFAAFVWSRGLAGRRWFQTVVDCATYAAGWALVVAGEGISYFLAAGDFLLRFHVVQRHYGTVDSIARAGLNTDPLTIPFSLFAPVMWWARGGWWELNQDQAYHGLLFCFAILSIGAAAIALTARETWTDRSAVAGFGVGVGWLLWPLLYQQFGSQSLTHMVPMHRLSRHLVVCAPGAMFATVAGCHLASEAIRRTGVRVLARIAWCVGIAAMLVHLDFNWRGEQIAYRAFHQIKDTYVRIRQRLPGGVAAIVADPGDLCFLDFWLNPLGYERVRMLPFARYADCGQIHEGIVVTQSNPGWRDGAPVILDTVRRLPCLTDPPAGWRLLYKGYPERVFEVDRP